MQLLLNIKDSNKANVLLEFLKSLNYINSIKQVEEDQNFEVPEWHKKIVLDRIKTSTPQSFKPWSEVKKQLKHKK